MTRNRKDRRKLVTKSRFRTARYQRWYRGYSVLLIFLINSPVCTPQE